MLVILQLQLGQHQHGLVMAVVVQGVEGDGLLQVLLGSGVVFQVVGGLRSQLVGDGLVVLVGIGSGDDFIGQRAGFRVLLLVVGVEQLLQLAAHLRGSLDLGFFTGGFREQHFGLGRTTIATLAALAGTRLRRSVSHHNTTKRGRDENGKHGLFRAAEDHGSPH
ncbi:hypothetical protein D3C81_1413590 [compost metagenome]